MKIKSNLIKFIILVLFIIVMPIPVYASGIDGTTIVLNPGHGGRDTGCINTEKNLFEKDINLKISQYLKDELLKYYNVKVILTHDGVNFPNDDTGDLAARAMVARRNNADLYASIHINDFSNYEKNGASVYVTSRTELPKYKEGMTKLGNMILDKLCALGINREGLYNNKLATYVGPTYQYYDGSIADYYADIRFAMRGDSRGDLGQDFRDGSGISTVLIEHCYINNSKDVQFLDSDEDLQILAKADADAIAEYYNLKFKSEIVNEITINKSNLNLLQGEKIQIIADVSPSTAKDKTIKWYSQDENIAKVDEYGNIEAVGIGQTNIIVKSVDNPNANKTIPVNVQTYGIQLNNNDKFMFMDETTLVNAVISPTWIENKTIRWESSNPEIIEVTQDGIITTKSTGTAIITVKWEEQNLSEQIEITVLELPSDTMLDFGNYKIEDDKISNIGANVSISEFLNNINISDNLIVEIQKLDEKQQYIGTNTKIIVKEKEHNIEIKRFTCIVYADVNGDGKISTMDYTLIKNHIMDVKKITDENVVLASDVSRDGKVSSMDYTLIKNHIMDVKKITIK